MQQAGKTKVLLAEDDLSLGYVIKDNLIDAGYDVVLCPDGQAAIDKFDKNEFGICLLDVMMPNKDGFAVARKIRQQAGPVCKSQRGGVELRAFFSLLLVDTIFRTCFEPSTR